MGRTHTYALGVGTLITIVLAGTVFLWLLYPPSLIHGSWWGLLALGLLTMAAQLTPIDIYGAGRISLSAALMIAAGMISGISAALILAGVVAVLQWAASRGRFHRFLFDLGVLGLSAAAAATIFGHVLPTLTGGVSGWLLPVSLLAGLGFYAVNIGLLSLVMAASERQSPILVWHDRFQWLWAHYLAYGLLAGLMVMAYRAIGIYGLLVFSLPLAMLRYAMKQYVDRTEENVRRLTEANEQLTMAHGEVSQALQRLTENYDATLLALSAALDSRDSETEGHSQRVVGYCRAIAAELGTKAEDIPGLIPGALLHDLGKIGVPDAILRKPGPLTDEERALMREHPGIGSRMLSQVAFLRDALPVIRHHHERWDGLGYPDGLKGEEIPLAARIFALADTFDAMTSDRPYRMGCSCEVALEEISRSAGTQFDPAIAEALLRADVEEIRWLSGELLAERSGVR